MQEVEKMVRENNADIIELNSVNYESHHYFYEKLGFYKANNFVQMAKFLE